jgi:hypothetical protein
VESELKMLRAIARLAAGHAIEIVPTFMGAHEIPVEYRQRRDEYVRLVIDEMIPAVAARALAEWCDVFCETGVFTPGESRRILNAGGRAGLKPRIHADELGPSGGSQVAAAVGARSADHLIFVPPMASPRWPRRASRRRCCPRRPSTSSSDGLRPARDLIAAGVPVALATDVNPGGGFSPSMPFAMALGCFGMGLTFEEALVAATINGAWSLDRADRGGEPRARQADGCCARRRGRHQPDPRRRAADRGRPQARRRGSGYAGGMTLSALPLTDLLAAFRSPTPTPGGGSAAALAGAVGASLLAMVAGLPKAKTTDEAGLARLSEAGARCTEISARLAALVDQDSDAYNAVMAAFKLPKGTDEEKAARSARIQEATRAATDTPLDVVRAGRDALGTRARGGGSRQPECVKRCRRRAGAAGGRRARSALQRGDQPGKSQGRGLCRACRRGVDAAG